MDTRSKKLGGKAITLHTDATTLPAPTVAGDGVDISSFRQGGYAPEVYWLTFDADGVVSLTDVLLDLFENGGGWGAAGKINEGTVDLTATVGFKTKVYGVGLADRAIVQATHPGTIKVTIKLTPIEVLA